MKSLIFALCIVFACGELRSQTNVWHPSAGHTQVPIWPGPVPDAQPLPEPETALTTTALYAGKPAIIVTNVSQPSITVYSPKGTNTGVAVVVFPGGGYKCLAIDLEGTEICEWLAAKGITGVLLKYRVPYSGHYWDGKLKHYVTPKAPLALQDAQRALGLVRSHAAEWHINPHKIGVIGFSAGGHMVTAMSTHFDQRSYPAVDQVDNVSCRPDFAIALYPGHLWNWNAAAKPTFALNPDIASKITRQTPPTFLLQAENDPVDDINNSLVYYVALKNAKVPVELHLYAEGGHAFGLRHTKFPITDWPTLVEKWLRTIGMTSE